MKMDRDINPDGMGKYALIKWRQFRELEGHNLQVAKSALQELKSLGILDEGVVGSDSEFMVIRLKDMFSPAALTAYARAAMAAGDDEWAYAVLAMAERAGANHPNCKVPD